jgi:L-amino acid N-acyltransferase YncA
VSVSASAVVRPCRASDLDAIRAIYAHYVLHGTATFELEPPDLPEIASRHRAIVGAGYPFLVATFDERVVGYAYASAYRARPAYRHTTEDSVYLDPAWTGRGIGRALLSRLVEETTAAGFRQMIGVIGDSANTASVRLHGSLGFAMVGTLRDVGHKFGRWIDTVVMQRPLGAGNAPLTAQRPG